MTDFICTSSIKFFFKRLNQKNIVFTKFYCYYYLNMNFVFFSILIILMLLVQTLLTKKIKPSDSLNEKLLQNTFIY